MTGQTLGHEFLLTLYLWYARPAFSMGFSVRPPPDTWPTVARHVLGITCRTAYQSLSCCTEHDMVQALGCDHITPITFSTQVVSQVQGTGVCNSSQPVIAACGLWPTPVPLTRGALLHMLKVTLHCRASRHQQCAVVPTKFMSNA